MIVHSSLPDLDQCALERSRQLALLIHAAIEASPTRIIGFDDYMALALYAPDLGYYAADNPIFGAPGDFVTAPESGQLFGGCVARQCAEILGHIGGDIIEYGAGSGRLALTVIKNLLHESPDAAFTYHIVEPSAPLRERQRALLLRELPDWDTRIAWHASHPPGPLDGVILANEVLDAMPAKRYRVTDGEVRELGVAAAGDGFEWRVRNDVSIPTTILHGLSGYAEGYTTEAIGDLNNWLAGLATILRRGAALICDYGYPRHEFLHSARHDGTLKCHFRHQVHDDPFYLPGLQDLTVAVNFTDLAEGAEAAGLTVSGFVTQTRFLLDCGIETLMAAARGMGGTPDHAIAHEAKRLLLPGEMGQTCKFMGLTRDYGGDMSGFAGDQRHYLAGFAEA